MAKLNKSSVTRAYNKNKSAIDSAYQDYLDALASAGGYQKPIENNARDWFSRKVNNNLNNYNTTSDAVRETLDSPTFRSSAELAQEHALEGFKRALNYKDFLNQYGRARNAKTGQFEKGSWTSMLQNFPWIWQGREFILAKKNGKDSSELVIKTKIGSQWVEV